MSALSACPCSLLHLSRAALMSVESTLDLPQGLHSVKFLTVQLMYTTEHLSWVSVDRD